jgi:hypothetical protein
LPGCLRIVSILHFLLSVKANRYSGQEADDRRGLAKVPEIFNKLVKERGPLGAVRSTVGLLMPLS